MNKAENKLTRKQLIRDWLTFQVKLFMDGIRDLVLSPVSLIAALIDFIQPPTVKNSVFYQLLKTGKRSDHWIGLFNAVKPYQDTENPPVQSDVDSLIAQLEVELKGADQSTFSKKAQKGLIQVAEHIRQQIDESQAKPPEPPSEPGSKPQSKT